MMNNTNKQSFLLVAAMLLIGLLTGCLKDDLSKCPSPFQVTIKALDADRNDITESGDVQQVILFVFDQDDHIYQTFTLTGEEVKQRKLSDIGMSFPPSKKFRLIALGNLDDKVDYSEIGNVNDLEDLYIRLKPTGRTRAINTHHDVESPGDLFGGELMVDTHYGGVDGRQTHVVEMNRLTVGITITAIDLKEWNGNKEGDYSFIVSETYDMISNHWSLMGETVSYAPQAIFVENGNLFAPIFYAFPTIEGKGFIIEILYNGEVIFTAERDLNGKEFGCEKGCTLNVIIDFRANLHIISEITPWNVVFQYVDFN